MSEYNGFSYEEFYEFIVDFFESDTTPGAREASTNLLEWWNKYVPRFIFTSVVADMGYYSLEQCSRGLQPHVQPHPGQHDDHRCRA